MRNILDSFAVAPYLGAWIEILHGINSAACSESPPTWGRGLKCSKYDTIEMVEGRRPLLGGVD